MSTQILREHDSEHVGAFLMRRLGQNARVVLCALIIQSCRESQQPAHCSSSGMDRHENPHQQT